jgi:hypothetical protein
MSENVWERKKNLVKCLIDWSWWCDAEKKKEAKRIQTNIRDVLNEL